MNRGRVFWKHLLPSMIMRAPGQNVIRLLHSRIMLAGGLAELTAMTHLFVNKLWTGLWATPDQREQTSRRARLHKMQGTITRLQQREQDVRTRMDAAATAAPDADEMTIPIDQLQLEYRVLRRLLERAHRRYQAELEELNETD